MGNENLIESLVRVALAALVLLLAILLFSCEKQPLMVCCQHYNGKTSGWVYTNPLEYEEDVKREFGVDMEGRLDYDSARVMFIHCKELQ